MTNNYDYFFLVAQQLINQSFHKSKKNPLNPESFPIYNWITNKSLFFYKGECWAGQKLESSRQANAASCIGESIAQHCQSQHTVCVGRENSNFVFTIQN